MNDYNKIEYWEERYSNFDLHQLFDWYQTYSSLKEIIIPFLHEEKKILHVGAGNSKLGEDMYKDGFTGITEIDFSQSAVRLMVERYKELSMAIEYKEMNVTNMKSFSNNQFNIVIDKGTLDSILCTENASTLVEKMIDEIYRVLDDNGIFICISYGNEDTRKAYFMNKDWEYRKDAIAKLTKMIITNVDAGEKDSKNFHHIYIMTKKSKNNI